MEAERAVAELERFLADRGDQLLRTATLLAGSRARLPFPRGNTSAPGRGL